ncbi:MAG: TrmH family RNA methyltransferase [Planctomycetaceae bacterium]
MNHALLEFLSGFVTGNRLRLFDDNLRQRTRHVTVVLEDIFQPHNASACLRSCDAFGVQDVHIIENRYEYRLNPDIELGSAQWLTLRRHFSGDDNTAVCIRDLREHGYRIVATSPRSDTHPLAECDVTRPAALLFGTEHEGLSETALNLADERVRIPTYGFAESLNISVAVAVALHHFTTQLRNSTVDWRLSESERNQLKLAWVRRTIGGKRLPIIEAEFLRRATTPGL